MIKTFISSLSPVRLYAYGAIAIAVILYITYTSIRINYLKSDNLKLEAENIKWQATVESLTKSVEKQNLAVEGIAKLGEDMQQLGQRYLKEARQGNTIRQPKINAATARIDFKNPTDCATAITAAKKELQP